MAGAHACGPSRRRFFVFQPFDSPETKGVGHPTAPRATHRAFYAAGACGVRTENRHHRQRRRPKRPSHTHTSARTYTLAYTSTRTRTPSTTKNPIVGGGGNSSTRSRPNVHPPAANRPPTDATTTTTTITTTTTPPPPPRRGKANCSVSQSVGVRRASTVCSNVLRALVRPADDRSFAASSEILRTSLSLPYRFPLS